MKKETISIHGGDTTELATKSVNLFDLVVEGDIYTRIINSTMDVIGQRVAALAGGVALTRKLDR